MVARDSVSVPIGTAEGVFATMMIHTLPGPAAKARPAPLVQLDADELLDATGEAEIQLLEDAEYIYDLGEDAAWTTDHPEMFSPDDASGRRGRLRARSYTGTVPVSVSRDGEEVGTIALEVRSRKLDYRTHYRWMLRDIANVAVGLVGSGFAASQQHLAPEIRLDTATAYQRFALLRHLLSDPVTEAALRQITANPHHDWVEQQEERDVRRGLPAGSISARALVRGTKRLQWSRSFIANLDSLPACVSTKLRTTTVDTAPNRLVKFALARWVEAIATLGEVMAEQPDSPARRRGLRELAVTLAWLDGFRRDALFDEVSDLTQFPSGNQILLKREGYREIFRTYVEVELAIRLAWQGGDDVFAAGQRDVATLYEYWCYLQMTDILTTICENCEHDSLVSVRKNQTHIDLRRGQSSVVRGSTRRLGRVVTADLYYNRSFTANASHRSWTVAMRPDCSLLVSADDERTSTWVHFDAKYRIDSITEIFGGEGAGQEVNTEMDDGMLPGPKREDLLKMHAYRDAIRRSAGAYVLYPGPGDVESRAFREYHEILPGLGAFALRPSETGVASGRPSLTDFLNDVIEHTASVISQHRRGRYWEVSSYQATDPPIRSGLQPGLDRPAADTLVVLAFVRDKSQLTWIHREHRYNLRTGQRRGAIGLRGDELAARFLVLYGPELSTAQVWRIDGQPEVWSGQRMRLSGYPRTEHTYLCLPITAAISVPLTHLGFDSVLRLARQVAPDAPFGAPVVVSWSRVAEWAARYS